jgi:hypothetical protein
VLLSEAFPTLRFIFFAQPTSRKRSPAYSVFDKGEYVVEWHTPEIGESTGSLLPEIEMTWQRLSKVPRRVAHDQDALLRRIRFS